MKRALWKRCVLKLTAAAVLFMGASRAAVRAADLEVGGSRTAGLSAARAEPDLVSQFADIFRRGMKHPDPRTREQYRRFILRDRGDRRICSYILRSRVNGQEFGVGLDLQRPFHCRETSSLEYKVDLFISEEELKAGGLKVVRDPRAPLETGLVVINLRDPVNLGIQPIGHGITAPYADLAANIVRFETRVEENLRSSRERAAQIAESLQREER